MLTLHFTLPLAEPVDPKDKDVIVDVYDPTFFVAFGFAKEDPVKIAGTPGSGRSAKIEQPDSETEEDAKALERGFLQSARPNSNFGAQFAQTAIITCAKH